MLAVSLQFPSVATTLRFVIPAVAQENVEVAARLLDVKTVPTAPMPAESIHRKVKGSPSRSNPAA